MLLASVMTWSRSEGGKSPRSTGAWSVLEAGQAVDNIAFSPLTHGVAVAVECVGHLLIGPVLGFRRTQNDPAAVDQCLGCRTGANQSVERVALLGGKHHRRCKRTRHCSIHAAVRSGERVVYADA